MTRCITDAAASASGATPKSGIIRDAHDFNTMALPIETALRLTNAPNNGGHVESTTKLSQYGNNLIKANLNNSGDLASVDSSDTYASCQTHPFLSQGDLTGEMADISCTLAEFDVDDYYFTSLDKDRPSTSIDIKLKSHVKKSASGDASLLSLGACAPMEEVMVNFQKLQSFIRFLTLKLLHAIHLQKTFQSFDMASRIDRGSHVSLNEPSIPKHRKTRFQQSSLQKCKLAAKGHSDMLPPKKHSYDSLDDQPTSISNPGSVKKVRRSSFMPSKSLASATKLINQHLFGIQGANSKGMAAKSPKK